MSYVLTVGAILQWHLDPGKSLRLHEKYCVLSDAGVTFLLVPVHANMQCYYHTVTYYYLSCELQPPLKILTFTARTAWEIQDIGFPVLVAL